MHIPDGFIAPHMYLPLYGGAAGAWAYGVRQLRRSLDDRTLPLVAALTAFSFVVMMIMVPLPGGTTAHASGIAILAIVFGVWTAFLCISMVLLLQALLFGDGGITSLPLNALAMGLVGSATALGCYRLIHRWRENAALFVAGWASTNASALVLAIALGLQPVIASDASGQPLFFPFGLSITLPAVMIPHALLGVGEGLLTLSLVRFVRQTQKRLSG
jgi:cobalt/nickel transport system permease protein